MQGTAKVGSDLRVLVTSPGDEDHEVLAKNILVAAGSRPFHPDDIPFEDPDVWDSDEFFSPARQLPKSIFIAGGGPVGVEFATVFAGRVGEGFSVLGIHGIQAQERITGTTHRVGVDCIVLPIIVGEVEFQAVGCQPAEAEATR